jgi:flavin-dependent dehydrogenase
VSAPEVVVVGGGPAGASAAAHLARAGRPVLLLERGDRPAHKICGEFLSVEAQGYLAALGIDPRALGGATIDRVRLVHRAELAETRLPFEGVGLTRRAMDEALLARAAAAGAEVRRGAHATALRREGAGLVVETDRAGPLRAGTLLLATGKHDVRGARRPAEPSDLVGFKTYFALDPRQRAELEGAIEVILFAGGYAGLQMVEDGAANLCLLVERTRLKAAGGGWPGLLESLAEECPHLETRLAGAAPLLERPLAISNVPYGFVARPGAGAPPGLFRLGDQAGVIHSFSGDGMSIALHSGRLAATSLLEHGPDGARYQRALRDDILAQVRLSAALYDASRSPLGRRAILGACRAWPGAMRWVAALTRVPERARRRAAPGAGAPDPG